MRLRAVRSLAVVWLAWGTVEGVFAMQDRRVVGGTESVSGTASPAIVAGGLVYTSAVNGLGVPGASADPSDVGAETRRAFDRLKTVLEAAGSSIGDVVNINVQLKHASDFDAMNAVYRTCVTDAPPARTTVQSDIPGGALVALSAIAQPSGSPRETLIPAGWVKSPRPYSYIVRTSDLVFLSGLVSRRGTDDQVVPGSVTTQMKTILGNAATLLKTAGLTMSDVVSARVFLTDDLMFDDMNAEYGKHFDTNPPARATGVAGLMGPESYVEVSIIASRTPKQVIGPLVAPTLPVSTAIRAGRRLFLSGVLGHTESNIGDPAAQAREALTRIGRTLDTAGVSFGDVVDSTVYLTDLWQMDRVDEVYKTFFPTTPPARTVAGMKLVAPTGIVEFMLTAVK